MKIHRFAISLAPLAFLASTLAAQSPGDPFIEQMTWTEIRDALAEGRTTVIVPVGGTEQNGPHMVMGKHNYVVTYAAGEIAKQLGTALVAPTVAWVPEGSYESEGFGDKPGVITNPPPSYQHLLEAAARSLAHHGFEEILFIGDSGGDQNGMQEVADLLTAEWGADGPTKVYALLDYYRKGQEWSRAWLQAAYGYDMTTIGTHAGISDTSAVWFVFPEGIRAELRYPYGGSPDAGVTGDPTKASAEIGRMVVNLKVVGALSQYRSLTAPPHSD